ncbi:MAG: SPOR domain-containing protein [Fidelibacterota bacterium]
MMINKRFYQIIFLVLWLPLLAQEGAVEQDESFDPLNLYEPSLPILDGSLIYEIITDIREPAPADREMRDSARVVEKMGWKVQLFSTVDFYEADSVYLKAVEDFIDQEVVKVFNSPYYKIRVGNCVNRQSAEELLKQALELHYRDAWIIRTAIKVEERLLFYSQ